MEEKYAQALASGTTRSDAFRAANPRAEGMKQSVVWNRASAMGRRPLVKARVTALIEKNEANTRLDAVQTIDLIVERLNA